MNKITEKIINRIKQDKKLLLIVFLGFIGMLLLLFSTFGASSKETSSVQESSIRDIESTLEKELENLLKNVDGAGKVRVMVTVDALEERIVAVNTETESENNSYSNTQEYVIIENSGDSDGLVLKTIAPVIRGVGIICEGADSYVVKQEITKLVSAALGISRNKIWVTKMKK